MIRTELCGNNNSRDLEKVAPFCMKNEERQAGDGLDQESDNVDSSSAIPFELYKMQTTLVVPREVFLRVTCDALSQYKYVGPNQRADLILACRYNLLC